MGVAARQGLMRVIFAMLAALCVAQCATSEDKRFRVGDSPRALVVIGLAESATGNAPSYTMLWRRLDENGAFTAFDDDTIFQPRTDSDDSVRVRGLPGEFAVAELEPGVYALDSIFALVRDRRVNYSANGVVIGPERPSFEVRAGEAIYLGIWEAQLEDAHAVVRPWRLEQADADAVMREADAAIGAVRSRQVQTRAVACRPTRLNIRSQRQVC